MSAPAFDAATTRDLSAIAREVQAETAFSFERVTTLIERYAKQGFNEIQIMPPKAISLHMTKAAGETVRVLLDLGFEVEWETHLYEKTDRFNPAGQPTLFTVLVVTWGRHVPVRWVGRKNEG